MLRRLYETDWNHACQREREVLRDDETRKRLDQKVCRSAGRERGTIEKESKQSHDIICPPKIEEVWEIHFLPIFHLRYDLFSCVNSYQIEDIVFEITPENWASFEMPLTRRLFG